MSALGRELFIEHFFECFLERFFWVLSSESTFLGAFLSNFLSALEREYFFGYLFEHLKKYSRELNSFMSIFSPSDLGTRSGLGALAG